MSAEIITKLAETYIAHTGLKETTVSSYAMNDGKRLTAIRKDGADVTSRRFNRVLQWFSTNWPEDLEWPQSIPRPAPSTEDAA